MSPEAQRLLEAGRAVSGPTPARRAAMKHAILAAVVAPGAATAAATTAAVSSQGAAAVSTVKLVVLGLCAVATGAGVTWVVAAPRAERPGQAPGQLAGPARRAAAPPVVAPPSPEVEPLAPAPSPVALTPSEPAAALVAPGAAPTRPTTGAAEQRVKPATGALPASPRPSAVEPTSPTTRVPAQRMTPTAPARTSSEARADTLTPAPLVAPPALPRTTTGNDVPARAQLEQEAVTLSSAMADVDANRHAEALAALAKYEQNFPAGSLRTEASVIEVLALCGLGRVSEAQALAEFLAQRDPQNPSRRRLERSCVAK
jgi:hypothetical protein